MAEITSGPTSQHVAPGSSTERRDADLSNLRAGPDILQGDPLRDPLHTRESVSAKWQIRQFANGTTIKGVLKGNKA